MSKIRKLSECDNGKETVVWKMQFQNAVTLLYSNVYNIYFYPI